MNGFDINRDKVLIEESMHPIYKQLTEGNAPLQTPFRMMKDVFLWAAALGHARNLCRPLQGRCTGILRWAPFTAQVDVPFLRALAISSTQDLSVIQHQGKILRIAEEYANGGIRELRDCLLDRESPPLWHLVDLLATPQKSGMSRTTHEDDPA